MQKFEKIEKHVRSKRTHPKIKYLDDYTIEFTVETNFYDKYFRIHYQDSITESQNASKWNGRCTFPRDRNQHYNVYFCQENVPMSGRFVTITGDRWFQTEEDVIDEIKRLCRNWQR